jgi:hypothetical protein
MILTKFNDLNTGFFGGDFWTQRCDFQGNVDNFQAFDLLEWRKILLESPDEFIPLTVYTMTSSVSLLLLLSVFFLSPSQLISMSFSFQPEPEYGSMEGVQGDWEPLTEALDPPTNAPPTPRGTGRKRGRPKGSGRGRASSKGSSPSPSPNPVISSNC